VGCILRATVGCILFILWQQLAQHVSALLSHQVLNISACEHVPAATNTHATLEVLAETVFSTRSVPWGYMQGNWGNQVKPVEYFHRDPASRRRRRKGKSQIWDSKIWSRVPKDSDPRTTVLARASSNCKRQTRPLVREGAPNQQTRNCHTSNKDLVVSPRWVLCSKTDWPADRRS
jgi:hypothetical protein